MKKYCNLARIMIIILFKWAQIMSQQATISLRLLYSIEIQHDPRITFKVLRTVEAKFLDNLYLNQNEPLKRIL